MMEYCARGSVYGVLSGAVEDRAAAAVLTWPRLLRFAWDAAKGMLYLHTLRPPVMHRQEAGRARARLYTCLPLHRMGWLRCPGAAQHTSYHS